MASCELKIDPGGGFEGHLYMCGIAGVWSVDGTSEEELLGLAGRMAKAIALRGPDDGGVWADSVAGIALGHRRLSVVDLSPAGHQPMASRSGRFIIAFNGEIYNHLEMRSNLQAAGVSSAWRGHSDTETLLAGFEHWGIEVTLNQTVGMFAIAIWDVQDRCLYLTRDRLGEKPLYYGWVDIEGSRVNGAAFAFGSELKALRALPGFTNAICRQAVAQYMRFLAVPAPRSIYAGVFKLEPGCLLRMQGVPPSGPPEHPLRPPDVHGSLTLTRWWSLSHAITEAACNQITDEVEALRLLEQSIQDSVRLQSLADVPLGAFLSGGLDSSTVVALMQRQAIRPVKTFTVGFEESNFDEAPYARAVAMHLGTDHSELMVSAADVQGVITALPEMYDEPFADSSQIPTHLICRAARQEVTVALSGDGGDELFGGYNRYLWAPRIWERLSWMPYSARQKLCMALAAVPSTGWDAIARPMNAMLGRRGIARLGEKVHKLAARFDGVKDSDDFYLRLVSEWQDPAHIVRGERESAREPASLLTDAVPLLGVDEFALRMMYRDSMTYLPDDILCKVDRAAMAVSLETRIPLLDHRVVGVAWRLPLNMKIRGGQGKWALRQVLYKHVPRELIERPKVGFGIPIGAWLRGPLRPWAENLLSEERLESEGYFYPLPIRQKWAEHLSGSWDHTASLWAVLMFGAWLESLS